MGRDFFGCYLLSSKHPTSRTRTYIGFTVNPRRRIRQHNGLILGGACKTKSWRPWDMALVLYGFPTKVQALQFEWAWQHPERSKIVRVIAARLGKRKMMGAKGKILLLHGMLREAPWKFFPLTLQFLAPEYAAHAPSTEPLPAHIRVFTAPPEELPVSIDDAGDEEEEVEPSSTPTPDDDDACSAEEDADALDCEVDGAANSAGMHSDLLAGPEAGDGATAATAVTGKDVSAPQAVDGSPAPSSAKKAVKYHCSLCEQLIESHIMVCAPCGSNFHLDCMAQAWILHAALNQPVIHPSLTQAAPGHSKQLFHKVASSSCIEDDGDDDDHGHEPGSQAITMSQVTAVTGSRYGDVPATGHCPLCRVQHSWMTLLQGMKTHGWGNGNRKPRPKPKAKAKVKLSAAASPSVAASPKLRKSKSTAAAAAGASQQGVVGTDCSTTPSSKPKRPRKKAVAAATTAHVAEAADLACSQIEAAALGAHETSAAVAVVKAKVVRKRAVKATVAAAPHSTGEAPGSAGLSEQDASLQRLAAPGLPMQARPGDPLDPASRSPPSSGQGTLHGLGEHGSPSCIMVDSPTHAPSAQHHTSTQGTPGWPRPSWHTPHSNEGSGKSTDVALPGADHFGDPYGDALLDASLSSRAAAAATQRISPLKRPRGALLQPAAACSLSMPEAVAALHTAAETHTSNSHHHPHGGGGCQSHAGCSPSSRMDLSASPQALTLLQRVQARAAAYKAAQTVHQPLATSTAQPAASAQLAASVVAHAGATVPARRLHKFAACAGVAAHSSPPQHSQDADRDDMSPKLGNAGSFQDHAEHTMLSQQTPSSSIWPSLDGGVPDCRNSHGCEGGGDVKGACSGSSSGLSSSASSPAASPIRQSGACNGSADCPCTPTPSQAIVQQIQNLAVHSGGSGGAGSPGMYMQGSGLGSGTGGRDSLHRRSPHRRVSRVAQFNSSHRPQINSHVTSSAAIDLCDSPPPLPLHQRLAHRKATAPAAGLATAVLQATVAVSGDVPGKCMYTDDAAANAEMTEALAEHRKRMRSPLLPRMAPNFFQPAVASAGVSCAAHAGSAVHSKISASSTICSTAAGMLCHDGSAGQALMCQDDSGFAGFGVKGNCGHTSQVIDAAVSPMVVPSPWPVRRRVDSQDVHPWQLCDNEDAFGRYPALLPCARRACSTLGAATQPTAARTDLPAGAAESMGTALMHDVADCMGNGIAAQEVRVHGMDVTVSDAGCRVAHVTGMHDWDSTMGRGVQADAEIIPAGFCDQACAVVDSELIVIDD